MLVYEEKTYTTQNWHVCKPGMWKKLPSIPFNAKYYFIKTGYTFLDHPVLKQNLLIASRRF